MSRQEHWLFSQRIQSIPSTCMAANSHLQLWVQWSLVYLGSACTWCTYMHVGKVPIRVKYK